MKNKRFLTYFGITFVASLLLLAGIAVGTRMETYQVLAFALGDLIVALVVALVATSDRQSRSSP